MLIRIEKTNGIPIYLQIIRQVEEMVVCGEMPAGELLPTVRNLAEQLVVNPNTVARAYRVLESKGLLTARRGSGTRVAELSAEVAEERKKMLLRARIDDLVQLSERMGLDRTELTHLLDPGGVEPARPPASAWSSAFDEPFID